MLREECVHGRFLIVGNGEDVAEASTRAVVGWQAGSSWIVHCTFGFENGMSRVDLGGTDIKDPRTRVWECRVKDVVFRTQTTSWTISSIGSWIVADTSVTRGEDKRDA